MYSELDKWIVVAAWYTGTEVAHQNNIGILLIDILNKYEL